MCKIQNNVFSSSNNIWQNFRQRKQRKIMWIDFTNFPPTKFQIHYFSLIWYAFIPFTITFQYLEAVQDLSGYQTVAFPPCTCSVRNNGFVTPRITYDHLELTACSANGIQEVKVNFHEFSTALVFTELFFRCRIPKFLLIGHFSSNILYMKTALLW